MGSDPYAAKGWPRAATGEVRSELDQFLARLTDLGATPDELAAVADSWDDLDPDDSTDPDAWTRARRAALVRQPDDAQLVAMIRAARDEYEVGTTTEDEAKAQDVARELARARAEAAERMSGNVASLLAWVGDDPTRAEAVLEWEHTLDGVPRKTLVEPLQALLAHAADPELVQ